MTSGNNDQIFETKIIGVNIQINISLLAVARDFFHSKQIIRLAVSQIKYLIAVMMIGGIIPGVSVIGLEPTPKPPVKKVKPTITNAFSQNSRYLRTTFKLLC